MIEAQTKQILAHLKTGADITPIEALSRFGCFRLGARIYDLKQDGHPIDSQMVAVGEGRHVKRYWLKRVTK